MGVLNGKIVYYYDCPFNQNSFLNKIGVFGNIFDVKYRCFLVLVCVELILE